MNTRERLTESLKDAMRAKDELRKRTIRLALAAIKNVEIDTKTELSEPAVLAILQKEIKSRHETIEGAERAGRKDLIAEAKFEIEVLEAFLPSPLNTEELEKLAKAAIAETGATSPREMGKVMQLLISQTQGRADGKTISQIVQKLLSQ
jgi:uncharacterized protein YqeY